jgi:Protein of unknown function (DUF1638)
MTTGLIICGALGREVIEIIQKYGWDAEVVGIPAIDHVFPDRIARHVERRIQELKDKYERLIVVYGDCGSQGALDEVLDRLGIERISGPHCYEFYSGKAFQELMDEEPGTYFLTDFMVRTFNGLIMKSMGLDRYPQLKDDYFRNYKRIVYLEQNDLPEYRQKAQAIASYLNLPLEIRFSGYGMLEQRLVDLMAKAG